ncbi:MAG: hypothetical protein QXQ46_00500 [Thermoplasmatales archaeon]
MKSKVMKHYYPPSYYRYQEENPVITIRLTKNLREELDKIKGEMSYAEIIRNIIRNDFIDIYNKVYNEGYEKSFKENAIWYYCYYCGKGIYIKPHSYVHNLIIKEFRKPIWSHRECYEKHRRGELKQGNKKIEIRINHDR